MAKVLVVYYSTYGHVETMAQAVAEGARSVAGAQVDLKRVPETVPEQIARDNHFKLEQAAPIAQPAELQSAVRNLLTNAIRYTPEGGRIRLRWRLDHGEGRIEVRDTGIGIAPEHLPRERARSTR